MVREAAVRTIGQRHFPVQLMGGAALHLGNIAEMKTGEGKTLTSVLPAYLNAIAGQGRAPGHGQRLPGQAGRGEHGPHPPFLGPDRRRDPLRACRPRCGASQYAADITYGTNNEFGFDYLRDNMAWQTADLVQRGHNFAIVDEADSILIDEARTPLIISGPAEQSARWYQEFARMAPMLKRDVALRGGRAQAHRGRHRGGRRAGRGPAGHRQPLRGREHPARRVPEQRAEGQGAVQARQGLHRHERPGAHRRRVHRPRARRPPLQRGPAPGDRGQGGRGGPGGEPDPGHHHAAELLPPLRRSSRG